MGGTCNTLEDMRNVYRILVDKPKEMKVIRDLDTNGREDNIRKNIRK
jgi:hypothetical protein